MLIDHDGIDEWRALERTRARRRKESRLHRQRYPGQDKRNRQSEYRAKWPEHVLRAAKYRAKKIGVPFDLLPSEIVVPAICPVLGIPLSHKIGYGPCNHSPSLDRVVPELGYVRGNVVVISGRANRIKYDATPEELERVAAYARFQTELVRSGHGAKQ